MMIRDMSLTFDPAGDSVETENNPNAALPNTLSFKQRLGIKFTFCPFLSPNTRIHVFFFFNFHFFSFCLTEKNKDSDI